jgi:hypothetical protein
MQVSGEVTRIEKENGTYTVHVELNLGSQTISLKHVTSETDPSEAVVFTARLRAMGAALAKAFEYDVNLK